MIQEQEVNQKDTFYHSPYIDEAPYPVSYPPDSISAPYTLTVAEPLLFEGIPVSQKPKEMDAIFSVFFLCFILLAIAFSSSGRYTVMSMIKGLFQVKERDNLFAETTGNDLSNRLLMISQTVLLSAVFVFVYFSGIHKATLDTLDTLIVVGSFSALIVLYLLVKWMGYKLITYVFLNPIVYRQWMRNWLSLLSFYALVIFIPTLLFYYVPFLHDFSIYFIVSWFALSRLIIIYKSYLIFFNSLRSLHYLFLYLCTQEIAPLFLLCKGFDYIFNVLVNCAL